MGLFRFGTKQKPAAERAPIGTRSGQLGVPTLESGEAQPAGVEVSEFNLDEDDFESMFGAEASRFSESTFDRDTDPWTSRRRLD